MKMIVNYKQVRDKRWKAGEQTKSTMTPHGNKVEWASTSSSQGVCLGLSIYWVLNNFKKHDFWEWLKPPAVACPQRPFRVADAGALPAYWSAEMINSLGGATEAVGLVKEVMSAQAEKASGDQKWGKAYRLTKKLIEANSTLRCDTDGEDTVPVGKIKGLDGYYVFFIVGVGEKSDDVFRHAIAGRIVAGQATIFDPNIGEGTDLSAIELENFFNHLAVKQYGLDIMHSVGALYFA